MASSSWFPPATRNHVKLVFQTTLCGLAAVSYGSCVNMLWNIGGNLTLLAAMAALIYLDKFSPPSKEKQRVFLLMVFAVLAGASINPKIHDPRTVLDMCAGWAAGLGFLFAVAIVDRWGLLKVLAIFFNLVVSWKLSWTEIYKFERKYGFWLVIGKLYIICWHVNDEARKDGGPDYVRHSYKLLRYLCISMASLNPLFPEFPTMMGGIQAVKKAISLACRQGGFFTEENSGN